MVTHVRFYENSRLGPCFSKSADKIFRMDRLGEKARRNDSVDRKSYGTRFEAESCGGAL